MKLYTGIVTNNDDPTHEGQVQVLVKEKDANNTRELHTWCRVIGSSAFGLVGNTGVSSVLHNGTNVYCCFDNDDMGEQCYIIGTVIGQINSSLFPDAKDKNGVHPIGNQGDSNIHPSCVNDYDTYTKTQIITTESGHMIRLTDMDGSSEIDIMHKSGSFISFKDDGTIKICAKKNLEIDVGGDMVTYVMKNNMSEIRGDSVERVIKGETHNVGKDRAVTVQGNNTVSVIKNNLTSVSGNNTYNVSGFSTEFINGGKTFCSLSGYTQAVAGNYALNIFGGAQTSCYGGWNMNVLGQRSTIVSGMDYLSAGTYEMNALTMNYYGATETHYVASHKVVGVTEGIVGYYSVDLMAGPISLTLHKHSFMDNIDGGTVPNTTIATLP